MLDDLFLIHEDLAYRHLEIGEKMVMGATGLFVLTYLAFFRKAILDTPYPLLIVAFAFLASSAVADEGPFGILVEDGLKWLGISFWCSYYALTAHHLLIASFPRRAPAPEAT